MITYLSRIYKFNNKSNNTNNTNNNNESDNNESNNDYIFIINKNFTNNRKSPGYILVNAWSVQHAIELWVASHKEHDLGINRGVVRVYDSSRKLLALIDTRLDFNGSSSLSVEIIVETLKAKRKRKKSLEKDRLLRINYSRENSLIYKAMKLRRELNKINKL